LKHQFFSILHFIIDLCKKFKFLVECKLKMNSLTKSLDGPGAVYALQLAQDLCLYYKFIHKLMAQPGLGLALLPVCHEEVKALEERQELLDFVGQPENGLDVVTCFQALSLHPWPQRSLFTMMMSFHCPTPDQLLLYSKNQLQPVSRPVSAPKFTRALGAELKKNNPTASMWALVQTAVSQYDCTPEEADIDAVGFRDVFFKVMCPSIVQVTLPDTEGLPRVERLFVLSNSDATTSLMSALFKKQLSYCVAYEYLFPSSVPALAKYKAQSLDEFSGTAEKKRRSKKRR
jgi:hypothetical protein